MSDLDKLFENAPEGAVELRGNTKHGYLRWFNKDRDAWDSFKWFTTEYEEYRTIATRPQPHFKATRENLEKIAKDAKGDFVEVGEPEWTHGIPPNEIYCKVNHGGEFVNCYLICRDDMGAFVYRIDGQYYSTMSESNLKPMKPTINTDRTLELMKTMCPDEWAAVERKYNVKD